MVGTRLFRALVMAWLGTLGGLRMPRNGCERMEPLEREAPRAWLCVLKGREYWTFLREFGPQVSAHGELCVPIVSFLEDEHGFVLARGPNN